MATAGQVNDDIAGNQKQAQADAREALLKRIAELAPRCGSSSALRDVAEAYALVVAPQRTSLSAKASASK